MPDAHGVDVSQYQDQVDWPAVAQSGKQFCYIRSSFSRTRDSRITENWQGAKAAGLLRGAYHFFRFGVSVSEQVDLFMSIFSGGDMAYPADDLPPALDLEWDQYGTDPDTPERQQQYIADARSWLDQVGRAVGKTAMIYSGRSYWLQIGNPGDVSQYPLWVAEYGVHSPALPSPWPSYQIWQYSGSGRCNGISTAVDLDIFNGDENRLRAFATGR